MDLTKMTRSELNALQGHLQTLVTAADVMHEGGLEPEICLTCEETVLRAAPILSRGVPAPLPAPELVEPLGIVPDIDAGRAAADASDAVRFLARAFTRRVPGRDYTRIWGADYGQPPKPEAEGEKADAAPNADAVAPPQVEASPGADAEVPPDAVPEAGPTLGPLSEDEKARILDLDRDGVSRRDIAAQLGRRIQTVALFLTAQIGKDGLPTHRTAVPAPADPVEPDVASFRHVGDVPRATVAELAVQRVAPVSAAPVSAEPVAPPPPVAVARVAPAGLVPPAGLKPAEREVWDHLVRLPLPAGWDAEMDLDLCEAFARGTKAHQIGLDLDCDAKAVIDRYKALTAVIRDDRGHLSIEGQTRFMGVLRARVKSLRAQVA